MEVAICSFAPSVPRHKLQSPPPGEYIVTRRHERRCFFIPSDRADQLPPDRRWYGCGRIRDRRRRLRQWQNRPSSRPQSLLWFTLRLPHPPRPLLLPQFPFCPSSLSALQHARRPRLQRRSPYTQAYLLAHRHFFPCP